VIALASLLIVVMLSLIFTRVATVALTLTGMSREAARFQARSALTGTGFTTSAAEAIVSHPVRRRIVLFLMLLGSAGLVTVVATLIFTFARANQTQGFERIGLAIVGLFVIFLISRSKWFDRAISPPLAQLLGRVMSVELGDYQGLLHLADGYTVRELYISQGHWMADRSLGELQLRREGVLVLGLQRAEEYIGAPTAPVTVRPGDTAILYGTGADLDELCGRAAGPEGDAAHRRRSVEHHDVVLANRKRAQAEQTGAPTGEAGDG
jgi:hypothetical protein